MGARGPWLRAGVPAYVLLPIRMRGLIRTALIAVLTLGGWPATAQDPIGTGDCGSPALQGRSDYERGAYDQAVSKLMSAVRADPLCRVGANLAGDWLGRAYVALDNETAALSAWEATLSALGEGAWPEGGDALVGRYLETLVLSGLVSDGRAAVAFGMVMRPTTGAVEGGEPYGRALANIDLVVPEDVRQEGFVGGDWRRGVSPGGDRVLARWWADQDPFPATAPNERVEEHLARVGTAMRQYSDPSQVLNYDDRGSLLVRFGSPTTRLKLTFDTPDLVRSMITENVGVTPSSFADNEIWGYGGIDQSMVYVLVDRGGAYRSGSVGDLFPSQLRSISGTGRRLNQLRRLALMSMRYAYGELATLALEYGGAWVEATSALEEYRSPISDPRSAVRTIQRELAQQEDRLFRVREKREPASYSRLDQSTQPVPFVGAMARFLEPDGQTNMLVGWALREMRLKDDEGGVGLVGSVLGTGDDDRTVSYLQTLSRDQVLEFEHAPPTVATVPCGQSECAPVVQIDLYEQSLDGALGPRIGTSVWDVPTRPLLKASGLEMSDIWPIEAARGAPFVAASVRPGTPLSLYFEAYGFEGGARPSRVHVEYEVTRRRRGSLLRRTRETPSAGDLRLSVRGTATEQFVILETSDWEGSDEVEVRVSVRDERTQAEVERTVTFEVDEIE